MTHGRRRLLIAAAGGTAVVAAGGGVLLLSRARGQAEYDAAVLDTWRHGATTELGLAEVLPELVRYATLAANSHNTQPWRFRLEDRSIVVLPDATRSLSAVDPDDHHLTASLGGAVENIVQAAPAFGLLATAAFDPASRSIRIDLEPSPRARTPLFDAIPHRQSTRADYDGRAVPPGDLLLLEAAGQNEGVRMMLFTEPAPREQILSYVVAANTAQMDDPAFMAELKSWIRFGYGDALATRDGLFGKCSGTPVVPDWLGRPLFDRVFSKDAQTRQYQGQLRSAAGVAVFVSDQNDPAHWLAAGRCSQRFALQATALGLRLSYINQPVEVPAVRGQFATYLGVGGRRPDLVMRFGYGPLLPRSLRRPVRSLLPSVGVERRGGTSREDS